MRYILKDLDCAACTAKIEAELRNINGLENTNVNFATQSVELPEELFATAQEVVSRVEPGVRLVPFSEPTAAAMEKDEKRPLLRTTLATVIFAVGLVFRSPLQNTPYSWAEYLVFLSAYFLVGWPVIRRAVINLFRGQLFDENSLMTIATIGAIAIHELPEAAAVMLFYAVGEYFQERAVDRSRRSIAALLDIRPNIAHLKVQDQVRDVRPEEIAVGETIIVRPGERIPLDGNVLGGVSFVDTSALTGESVPRKVEPGEQVLAGMINGQDLLIIEVERPFSQSAVARILELVEKAAERKAPTEQFITTFSRYYTPAVVLGAAALAVLPPLFLPGASFSHWIYRALILLVISCPCALVVSIPLGYFGGIGAASRQGILVKGANHLDALTELHTVAFDKTGTLTRGVFRVTRLEPYDGFTRDELLALAAKAESFSNHPIAQSIRQAYGTDGKEDVVNYTEIPGHGVRAQISNKVVLVGNDRLLHREGINHPPEVCELDGTGVHVAVNGTFAGYIVISDEIKANSGTAVQRLKKLGVQRVLLLTGDEEQTAKRVAEVLGLDDYYAGLLPEDKVRKVEELASTIKNPLRQKLAFVGDGINDAPVLTRADIGVAMGAMGSDAAIEAADVVLMEDSPERLATAVEIARFTRRIVKENIVLALGIKAFLLSLGVLGSATIWGAVFADVGVALLAILNATRTLLKSGVADHSTA
ncbi:MAG: cadmium-translocating P-type ATPase [Firmicutes bacterium]|nr:cadmium-translocating P-type ATPase [Bacillota bacterium]